MLTTSPTTSAHRLTLLGVLVAVVALVTACSHQQLDTSKAQTQIGVRLTAYYRPALVTGTTCPAKVKAAKGATFRCTASVEGQPVGIVVTQLDSKGAVSFEPERAVIAVDKTVQDLKAKLAALYDSDGAPATVGVDCGRATVRVLSPKASFTCAVTVGAQRFSERVTVDDVAGHVSYRPVTK